jgi:hypothetical protein
MTNHEDSLLFVGGLMIALCWAITRGGRTTWFLTVLVSAHLIYAMVLNNRRLVWVELVLSLVLMVVMLPRGARRRLRLWMPILAPLVLGYAIVGWGQEGAIFAPVKALSTAGSNEDASSLARQEEIRNLLHTLGTAGNPLLGTGWGVPYSQVTRVYTNFPGGFWQYPYLPHNSILGIAAFSGLVGIAGIWLVVPVTALLAMRGYQGATLAVSRAAAMTVVCFLPAYGVQCYGDIGFQSFTGSLLLGVAMASAGKLAAWAEASAAGPRQALAERVSGSLSPRRA